MAFRVRPGLVGMAMELFIQLFGDLLAFVYHCLVRDQLFQPPSSERARSGNVITANGAVR